MTYWLLNAGFLSLVAVLVVAAIATRRTPSWRALLIGVAGMLVLTAIFDNVMIAAGLVAYDDAKISGLTIGLAPIEDFAYAVAAAVGLPCLWVLIAARAPGPQR